VSDALSPTQTFVIAHRPRVAGNRLAAAAIGPLQALCGAYISKPELVARVI
jgi:hypothetical protein